MTPESCERCGAPDPVPGLGATALCEDCILKALASRFPVGNLSLEELAAAVRAATGDKHRQRRVREA
jgi:hypothetical protein